MVIFVLIFVAFLVIVLSLGVLLYLLPLLIGMVFAVIIHTAAKHLLGKPIAAIWNVCSIAVVAVSSVMLWADIADRGNNSGPLPFVILLVYGLVSLSVLGILALVKAGRKKEMAPTRETAALSPKESARQELLTTLCRIQESKQRKLPAGENAWRYTEQWEDYPLPDYDAIHTYCQVAFDDSGKIYYYRTRNPDLKVGDTVYVPFGKNAPRRIGVIIRMDDLVGHEVPFPLEKTKYIYGKVE